MDEVCRLRRNEGYEVCDDEPPLNFMEVFNEKSENH